MKTIDIQVTIATGGHTFYHPVPCRGTVKSIRLACNATMVATGTLIVSRSTTAVNTVTIPTGDTAAGVIVDGTPDTTIADRDLIFDPDSSTAANQVIKFVTDSNFVNGAGMLAITLEFDDSARVEQAASEA